MWKHRLHRASMYKGLKVASDTVHEEEIIGNVSAGTNCSQLAGAHKADSHHLEKQHVRSPIFCACFALIRCINICGVLVPLVPRKNISTVTLAPSSCMPTGKKQDFLSWVTLLMAQSWYNGKLTILPHQNSKAQESLNMWKIVVGPI